MTLAAQYTLEITEEARIAIGYIAFDDMSSLTFRGFVAVSLFYDTRTAATKQVCPDFQYFVPDNSLRPSICLDRGCSILGSCVVELADRGFGG